MQDSASPLFKNCLITNTSSPFWGGGVSISYNCTPEFVNCVFSGNSAGDGGALAVHNSSVAIIINCTFFDNVASLGGGIYINYSGSITMTNCIMRNDATTEITLISGTATVTYSDIEGGYSGTGNKNCDPHFAGAGDYHLTAGSFPCVIDAGTNFGAPADDIDGDRRPQLTGYDMGCDEFKELKIPDTSTSTALFLLFMMAFLLNKFLLKNRCHSLAE